MSQRPKYYQTCTREGCAGTSGFISFKRNNQITCQFCPREYCTLCRLTSHGGACTMTPSEQSLEHIQAISKLCPNCHIPTIKNEGCNHMQCIVKTCRVHWCWSCVQVTRDPGVHNFGH